MDGYTTNPGDLAWNKLKSLGYVTIFDRTPSNLVFERIQHADIIITNKVLISKSLLKCLSRLKLIVVMATGFNVVDIQAARSQGIPVCNVRDYSSKSVAQQVFAFMLHFQNKITAFNHQVKQGDWTNSSDFTFFIGETHELFQKTIGIVGFGKIGQEVAKIANAFGMKILVSSRKPERDAAPHIEIVSLDYLLSECDFISLHVPLNDITSEMINTSSLNLMKSTSILINTGRGQLIDEVALSKALKLNKIGGAGLDVLCDEPPLSNHVLIGLENCVITPHTAWASQEARTRLLNGVIENIRSFQEGKLINVVN